MTGFGKLPRWQTPPHARGQCPQLLRTEAWALGAPPELALCVSHCFLCNKWASALQEASKGSCASVFCELVQQIRNLSGVVGTPICSLTGRSTGRRRLALASEEGVLLWAWALRGGVCANWVVSLQPELNCTPRGTRRIRDRAGWVLETPVRRALRFRAGFGSALSLP